MLILGRLVNVCAFLLLKSKTRLLSVKMYWINWLTKCSFGRSQNNITVSDEDLERRCASNSVSTLKGPILRLSQAHRFIPQLGQLPICTDQPNWYPRTVCHPYWNSRGWVPTAELPEDFPLRFQPQRLLSQLKDRADSDCCSHNPPTPTPFTDVCIKKKSRIIDSLSIYGIAKNDIERILSMNLRDKLMADVTKDLQPVEERVWVRHIW